MPDDPANLNLKSLKHIRARAQRYFKRASSALSAEPDLYGNCRDYWSDLPPRLQALSRNISAQLGAIGRELAQALTLAPLLTEASKQNAGHDIRGMRAALRLRLYEHSDQWNQYDEDEFRGVVLARESEESPLGPIVGQEIFENLAVRLQECIELVPVLHADKSKQPPTPEGQVPPGKLTEHRRSPTISSLRKATLTTKEAADALGYSHRYIYALEKEGKLTRAAMTGKKRGALRIMTSSVRKMLKASK